MRTISLSSQNITGDLIRSSIDAAVVEDCPGFRSRLATIGQRLFFLSGEIFEKWNGIFAVLNIESDMTRNISQYLGRYVDVADWTNMTMFNENCENITVLASINKSAGYVAFNVNTLCKTARDWPDACFSVSAPCEPTGFCSPHKGCGYIASLAEEGSVECLDGTGFNESSLVLLSGAEDNAVSRIGTHSWKIIFGLVVAMAFSTCCIAATISAALRRCPKNERGRREL